MDDLLIALTQGMVSPDEAHGRVYGWLPGVVTDVDDRLKRVKARIGKQGDNESTEWLLPMGIGSVESLPEKGDPIGVMFMDGDVHRGAYFYFPQSTTNGRPMEPMVLGTTAWGVINQIQDDLKTLVAAYNGQTYSNGGHPAAVSMKSGSGLASDGSTIPMKTGNQTVLSKRSLVR